MYRAKLTVSKDFKFGETNKSADFLKKFPLGKVKMTEIYVGNLIATIFKANSSIPSILTTNELLL